MCCYYSVYDGLTRVLRKAYPFIKLLLQYGIYRSNFALELKLIVVILNRELLIEADKIKCFSLT